VIAVNESRGIAVIARDRRNRKFNLRHYRASSGRYAAGTAAEDRTMGELLPTCTEV